MTTRKVVVLRKGLPRRRNFLQEFFETKLNYIRLNPVRAGIVEKEEDYMYSSCGDYSSVRNGELDWGDRGLQIPIIGKFDIPC